MSNQLLLHAVILDGQHALLVNQTAIAITRRRVETIELHPWNANSSFRALRLRRACLNSSRGAAFPVCTASCSFVVVYVVLRLTDKGKKGHAPGGSGPG